MRTLISHSYPLLESIKDLRPPTKSFDPNQVVDYLNAQENCYCLKRNQQFPQWLREFFDNNPSYINQGDYILLMLGSMNSHNQRRYQYYRFSQLRIQYHEVFQPQSVLFVPTFDIFLGSQPGLFHPEQNLEEILFNKFLKDEPKYEHQIDLPIQLTITPKKDYIEQYWHLASESPLILQ